MGLIPDTYMRPEMMAMHPMANTTSASAPGAQKM